MGKDDGVIVGGVYAGDVPGTLLLPSCHCADLLHHRPGVNLDAIGFEDLRSKEGRGLRTRRRGGLNRKLSGFGIEQDPDKGCTAKHIGCSEIEAQTIAPYGHYS